MSKSTGKIPKLLALLLTAVLTLSAMAIAPPADVKAAPAKYVKSLKISTSSKTLKAGDKTTIKATVSVKGSVKKNVKVTTSNSKVASVKAGKGSKKGVTKIIVTAKNVKRKSTATIKITTAKKNKNRKKIAKSVRITVNPQKKQSVDVEEVAVSAPESSLTVGDSMQLSVVVSPSNATNKTVSYRSSNPEIATVNSQTGLVSAIAPGNVQIWASAGSKSSSVELKILPAIVSVNSVAISAPGTSLSIGSVMHLSAVISPDNATDKTVTYTSNNPSVATVDSNSGTVTAIAAGKVTITASAGGKSGSVELEVTPVKVSGITLDKDKLTIAVNEESKLTATVQPTNATNREISWSSADSSIATVSKEGILKGVAAGKTTITVTTSDGGVKASCEVTVIVNVESVTVSASASSMPVGGAVSVTANVLPENATDKTVTYQSKNPSVATVDSKSGVVTAVAPGKVTITASAGGKSGSVELTVLPNTVTGVTLDAETLTMTVNEQSRLHETVLPASAVNRKVSWTSTNPSVASVSAEGVVKAITAGTTDITVTTEEGGFSASCKVTVTEAPETITDGFTVNAANSVEQYSDPAKNDYVYMVGKDASMLFRLGSEGKAIGNHQVKLELTPQYGNAEGMYKIEGQSSSKFDTTNSDGYVRFVVSLSEEFSQISALDGLYQSYLVTISSTSDSKISMSLTLSFGSVYMQSAHVTADTNIEPGENARIQGWDGIAYADSKNGAFRQVYVTSQQTSTENVDHSVTIAAYPVLRLPATKTEVQTGSYIDTTIGKKSGSYSIYNDETNTTTTTTIESIPAGLEWASIYFKSIDLSEYTQLVVNFYYKNNGVRFDQKILDITKLNEDAKTMQIPVQKDFEIFVEIALISEGQVNDDRNDGYEVIEIRGEWATTNVAHRPDQALENTVQWSEDSKFSRSTENSTLTYEQVQQYIPADSKYLNPDYSYTYSVPAFPSVGNAVIYVKSHQSGDTLAYFLYYSENIRKGNEYQNVNDILPYNGEKAVLVSESEVRNKIGSLQPDGNFVKVDSKETGYTPLTASIDLSALGVDISNGAVYSSVQWAPYYNPGEIEIPEDFYSLLGQQIEVTAQLVDANGNQVSQEGKDITFRAAEGYNIHDFVSGTLSTKTDKNGQCKFTLTNKNGLDYLEGLKAESTGYNVMFAIKDKKASLASFHWVNVGLYFKDAVENGTEYFAFNETKTVEQNMEHTVNSNWILGFMFAGRLPENDQHNNLAITKITGADIDFYKTGVGAGEKDPDNNTAYKLSSDKTGTTELSGNVNEKSFSGDVKFTITNTLTGEEIGTFDNVGTGTVTGIRAGINLKISWVERGVISKIISPLGGSLDSTTAANVYVKVTGEGGNPLNGKEVSYKISGLFERPETLTTTNEYGLVCIPLAAPGIDGRTTITAIVGGHEVTENIDYATSQKTDPLGVMEATLDMSGPKYKVNVRFNSTVKPESIHASAFSITNVDNTNDYKIEDAVLSGNDDGIVILTLADTGITNENLDRILLKVQPYESDHMTNEILDTDNRKIPDDGINEVHLTEME